MESYYTLPPYPDLLINGRMYSLSTRKRNRSTCPYPMHFPAILLHYMKKEKKNDNAE